MFSGLDAIVVTHGRRWTALASFVLQGIIVSAALILPLLHPVHLPEAFAKHWIFLPPAVGDPDIRPHQQISRQNAGGIHILPILVRHAFTFPTGPNHPADAAVPTSNPDIGPIGPGSREGIDGLFSEPSVQPIYHPAVTTEPRAISVVMEGNLIHRVEPRYPAIAQQIRLQGVVVLQAFVSANGRIERPKVVSGPAILAQAALDAVRQWEYRPYYLNGTAVEVETEITVKFILNQ